jgi:type I restriction-modification system DNA methylase subunit
MTMILSCAGTGGMLSIADEYIAGHNPNAQLALFGREVNAESYAICMADMLITGHEIDNIVFGNTLSNPGHRERRFGPGLPRKSDGSLAGGRAGYSPKPGRVRMWYM